MRILSLKEEGGFTLLDSLLQLMILVLFAHFFLLFCTWYSQKSKGILNSSELQWELFAFQLQNELTEAEEIYYDKKSIHYFTENRGDVAVHAIGMGELRRDEGYQPLLFGIRDANFDYRNYVVNMSVYFANGDERSRVYIVPNVQK
ncbi:competence type IV pilus minor pilin ComGF [Rummeliibacillus sp. JY-2-4R]